MFITKERFISTGCVQPVFCESPWKDLSLPKLHSVWLPRKVMQGWLKGLKKNVYLMSLYVILPSRVSGVFFFYHPLTR